MRQTHLQAELLAFMADKGLQLHVLSPMEEVQATYAGFEWALEQEGPESMIFVDQGGGSTEVSYISSGEIVDTMAVDYGTLNSSVRFQSLLRAGLSVQDALHSVGAELQEATECAVQAWGVDVSVPILSAIGSAMTNLCKGLVREERHGRSWSLDALAVFVQEQEAYLLSLSAEVLCRQSETGYTPEQKRLQMYLGLSMLMVLMRSTGCQTLVVNGVGMRFGIYSLLKDEA
jgi:exopolyphosphatase/pppGpp-phosphohydrolase